MLGLSALSKTVAGFVAGYFYNENKITQILSGYQFILVVVRCIACAQSALFSYLSAGIRGIGWRDAMMLYGIPTTVYTAALALLPMFVFCPTIFTSFMTLQDDIQIYSKRRTLYVVIGADVHAVHRPPVSAAADLRRRVREKVGGKQHPDHPEGTGARLHVRPERQAGGGQPSCIHGDRHAVRIRQAQHRLSFHAPFSGSRIHPRPSEERRSILSLCPGEDQARYRLPRHSRRIEENRDRLPGVDYQIESKRFYTTKANASHILGYTKEISENPAANDVGRIRPGRRRRLFRARGGVRKGPPRTEGRGVQHRECSRPGHRQLRQRQERHPVGRRERPDSDAWISASRPSPNRLWPTTRDPSWPSIRRTAASSPW